MRISDWSSDVCSSDLGDADRRAVARADQQAQHRLEIVDELIDRGVEAVVILVKAQDFPGLAILDQLDRAPRKDAAVRSEEHTSELQSLMRISYAVLCLKNKTTQMNIRIQHNHLNFNHTHNAPTTRHN